MRQNKPLDILRDLRRMRRGLGPLPSAYGTSGSSGGAGTGHDALAIHTGDAAGGDVGGSLPTSLTVPGLAGKQPLDSDLSAIALLSTTPFGRSCLELANSAAGRTLLSLGTAALLDSDTDTALAANSDSRFATQRAVKAYIDQLIAISDAMVFKGVIDCSPNPNYPAADRGNTYKVSVAGRIGGGSGPKVEVNDALICTVDGTASGTDAAVGANWEIIQANIDGAVIGPSSATSHAIASYNGTTGKLIEDSAVPVSQVPSAGEKSALGGTAGTPGAGNRFMTDQDPRANATQLAYSAAVSTLVAGLYLTLGSTNGLVDQSAGGHNGTAGGGVTIGGGGSLTSESHGSTVFDGANDVVTSTYAPFVTNSVRSFVIWGNTVLGSTQVLWRGSGTNGPVLVTNLNPATGEFQITFDPAVGTGAAAVTWTVPIPQFFGKTWSIGLTFDESASTNNAELFFNGVSMGTRSVADNYSTPGNFQVGQSTSSFNGSLSDVAVFEKLLTPASFSWLHNIGIGSGGVKDWGIVPALPGSPLIGDTCTFDADNSGGVLWRLLYTNIDTTYPWNALGKGPPIYARDDTSRTTASATYVALTGGISVVNPLKGVYDVEVEGYIQAAAGQSGLLSYAIGGTAASDAWACQMGSSGSGTVLGLGNTKAETRQTITAALQSIAMQARSGSGTATFRNMRIRATPVKVG